MLQDAHSFEPWCSQDHAGIEGAPPSVSLDHNEIDADTWEELVPDAIREFNPDLVILESNYVYLVKLWGGARAGFYAFAEGATETERDWLAGVEAHDEMTIEYVDGLWFWCQYCKEFDRRWGFDSTLCENSDGNEGTH